MPRSLHLPSQLSVLAPLLGALLLVGGCGEPAGHLAARADFAAAHGPKVAIIGIDGASFQLIDALLAQERLPNLAALIEHGSRTVLLSATRPDASPVLWTTMMTGVGRERHGITAFHKRDGERWLVYTSDDREVPALWNMVDLRGGTVGIAGIWCTWPAEPVNGWIVSDRFAHTAFLDVQKARAAGEGPPGGAAFANAHAGIVHPPELLEDIAHLSLSPNDVTRDELLPLIELTDEEWERLLAGRGLQMDALATLKFGWQAQESVARASLELLETYGQPDLFVTFLELPDRMGHFFHHTWEGNPGVTASDGDDGWEERWSNVLPGSYEVADEWVGRFLEVLEPDTTIFIVSDHGMKLGGQPHGGFPRYARSGVHEREGVLIAAGPAIRRGAEAQAHLVDIVPTVLAALGLPGSSDLEGRVLEELLDPQFVRQHPQGAPLDDLRGSLQGLEHDTSLDETYLDKLRAIGYVDDGE